MRNTKTFIIAAITILLVLAIGLFGYYAINENGDDNLDENKSEIKKENDVSGNTQVVTLSRYGNEVKYILDMVDVEGENDEYGLGWANLEKLFINNIEIVLDEDYLEDDFKLEFFRDFILINLTEVHPNWSQNKAYIIDYEGNILKKFDYLDNASDASLLTLSDVIYNAFDQDFSISYSIYCGEVTPCEVGDEKFSTMSCEEIEKVKDKIFSYVNYKIKYLGNGDFSDMKLTHSRFIGEDEDFEWYFKRCEN